jgi:hypothetical protein
VSWHIGHTRVVTVVIGLCVVVAGVTACDQGDDLPPPPPDAPVDSPSPPAPTQSLDARDAEAWQEIQARFDSFMETWIKWSAEGAPGGFVDPATAELHEYADVFLWDEAVAQLGQEADNGQVRTGRPEWRDANLIGIDWEREIQDLVVPEAVFQICVDDSEWVVVDTDSGEPTPAEPGGPQMWRLTAWWIEDREFGPDGWAMVQREVDRSQPC